MGQPLLVLPVTLTALVGCDSDSDPTPSERNSVDSRQIGGREPCRVAVTQGDDVQSAGLRRPSATVTVVPGPVSVGFRGGCPDDVTGYFVTRSGRALESSEGIKPRPSSHPARSGVATMCSDRARLVEDRLPSDSIPFDSQPDHPPATAARRVLAGADYSAAQPLVLGVPEVLSDAGDPVSNACGGVIRDRHVEPLLEGPVDLLRCDDAPPLQEFGHLRVVLVVGGSASNQGHRIDFVDHPAHSVAVLAVVLTQHLNIVIRARYCRPACSQQPSSRASAPTWLGPRRSTGRRWDVVGGVLRDWVRAQP
jgi:hypothetical protein